MIKINKKIDKAFGKKVFLLGKKDGINYWLEEPKWDCGWYWSMGYIETYRRNKTDINSMFHFDDEFLKNPNKNGYDAFLEFFDEITLNDNEMWTFIELMSTAYTLKKSAEVLGRGGSHYTNNPCKDMIINVSETTRINKEVLPCIFERIEKLLSE